MSVGATTAAHRNNPRNRVNDKEATAPKAATEAAARPKAKPMEIVSAYEGPRKPGMEKLTGEAPPPAAAAPVNAPQDPKARAGWWKGLTPAQQDQAIKSDPKKMGSMDGLPASARDKANRMVLKNDIDQLRAEAKEAKGNFPKEKQKQLENAEAVERELKKTEEGVGSAQLLAYDPAFVNGEGRAAIVAGNLDTAKHVSVSVPGLGSDVSSYMDNMTRDSLRLHKAAGKDRGEVATVSWMGYDAPSFKNVASDNAAENGAKLLASDVAGIRASREGNQPHLTVIGHSYGSTTTSIAADKHNLQADDLVLIGSPGAGSAKSVKDYDPRLANGHVWVGSASRDIVTKLDGTGSPFDPLGQDPAEDKFGAQRFTAEAHDRGAVNNHHDHSKYYNDGSESLNNLADIVTGDYGGVERARQRHKKELPFVPDVVEDPERERRV